MVSDLLNLKPILTLAPTGRSRRDRLRICSAIAGLLLTPSYALAMSNNNKKELLLVVLFVGFWAGVIYAGYRVLKAIWKRRKGIATWTVAQKEVIGGRIDEMGDGTKRAKRDILRYQELEALAKLHNDGVIDDDEFEKRKRVALGEQTESE
jgi:hypothetical protein